MTKKNLLFLLLLFPVLSFCQNTGGFRILPEAGLSDPLGDFKEDNVFAKRGTQFGLHLDKMWGRIGLGLYGGWTKNDIDFADLLPAGNAGLSIARSEEIGRYDWQQLLVGIGPVLQLDISKKLSFDLTAKPGLARTTYPDFSKSVVVGEPLSKTYLLYQTRNENIEKKLNLMLLSALRLNFKATKRIDLSLGVNYRHVRDVLHSYRYLDADLNPDLSNEALIQSLLTAPTVTETRKCHFNAIGATIGIGFLIGGKEKEQGKMDPPVPDYPADGSIITQQEADSLVLQWSKESPAVDNANYHVWLYEPSESGRKKEVLIFHTKVIRSLEVVLPEQIRLEAGMSYTWKVQAVDDRKLKPCPDGCYSVLATFHVSKSGGEGVLKRKLDAGYYTLFKGNLNFKYEEEYLTNGNNLEFKIYDKNRTLVLSNTSPGVSLNIINKDNRCSLALKAIHPALPPGFYILEVKDKNGVTGMLRFKL